MGGEVRVGGRMGEWAKKSPRERGLWWGWGLFGGDGGGVLGDGGDVLIDGGSVLGD